MIELYAHQRAMLSLLRLNDGFALFAEQGTGKSFPVLFRLAELAERGRIGSALIVAPKAVCESWREKVALLDEGQQAALERIGLRVASYDMAWRRPELAQATFDAVVLDESHYVKTPTAKRTKACLALCARARYRYALTGTPTSNGQLCNLWSQLAAVDPVVERGTVRPACLGGESYWAWLRANARLDQYHKPVEYTDVAAIQRVLQEVSFRVTKAECLDLPEKLPDELWRVGLPKAARAPYREMARHSVVLDLDTLAGNPLTRALRLRQIASGFMDTDDGGRVEYGTEKLAVLEAWLAEREAGDKAVVFCEFRHSIDAVSSLLDGMGAPHVVLDGRQPDKGAWRRFQADPAIRAIVCQYQTGSAGIDLFAADACVFFEPTLSSSLNEQARDRIHRPGQRRPCSYFYLIAEGTIEQAIYDALAGYADFDRALFERYLATYHRKGGGHGARRA